LNRIEEIQHLKDQGMSMAEIVARTAARPRERRYTECCAFARTSDAAGLRIVHRALCFAYTVAGRRARTDP